MDNLGSPWVKATVTGSLDCRLTYLASQFFPPHSPDGAFHFAGRCNHLCQGVLGCDAYCGHGTNGDGGSGGLK